MVSLVLAAAGLMAQSRSQLLASGKQTFMTHCAQCHGPNGEGGRGPQISATRLSRAPNDQALVDLLRHGVPGTEMPPTSASMVPDPELRNLIAFIRSLSRVPTEHVVGDIAKGGQLFTQNCSRCHTIRGRGTFLGPDLTDIGSRRSGFWLKRKLLDPQDDVTPGYALVRIETNDSRSIVGIRLNEDTFSIQIRDLSGQVHSYWKQELKQPVSDTRKTIMPNYRAVFNESQLQDVVAYLHSLRAAP